MELNKLQEIQKMLLEGVKMMESTDCRDFFRGKNKCKEAAERLTLYLQEDKV